MNRCARWILYLLPLLALVALVLMMPRWLEGPAEVIREPDRLVLFASTALQPPVQDIAEHFQRRTGVRVEVAYGSSRSLFDRLLQGEACDVLLTDDPFFLGEARSHGLIEGEVRPVALLVPVIMVVSGNPKGIASLADVLSEGVRLGLVEDESNALGRVTPRLFTRHGIDVVAARAAAVITRPSAQALARSVEAGVLDAAVVWRSAALQHPHGTAVIEISGSAGETAQAAAAVLAASRLKDEAGELIDFLGMNLARQTLEKYHYDLPALVSMSPSGL